MNKKFSVWFETRSYNAIGSYTSREVTVEAADEDAAYEAAMNYFHSINLETPLSHQM